MKMTPGLGSLDARLSEEDGYIQKSPVNIPVNGNLSESE
jgi:hypothetical protein